MYPLRSKPIKHRTCEEKRDCWIHRLSRPMLEHIATTCRTMYATSSFELSMYILFEKAGYYKLTDNIEFEMLRRKDIYAEINR